MSRSSLARRNVRVAAILIVAAALSTVAACGGSSDRAVGGKRGTTRRTEPTTTGTPTTTAPLVDLTAQPCHQSAPPNQYEKPQGISVALAVLDPADAERKFKALSEGGNVTMPIQQTFWAQRFGMVTDKFGIPWMVNCPAQ